MRISRAGLSVVIIVSLSLGAGGGLLIGRGWRAAEHTPSAATVILPTGQVAPPGAPKGTAGGAAPATDQAASLDLSGLPPADVWRRLIEIKDPASRTHAVRQMLNTVPTAELPLWMCKMMEAFKYGGFDEHDPTEKAQLFGSFQVLLDCITTTHPRECLTGVIALDRKGLSDYELVEGLLRTWAHTDLDAARQFYEREIVGGKHPKAKDLARGLAREMARTDPRGALEWAESLTKEDGAQVSAVASAFEAILRADRNEAIALLTSRAALPGRPQLAELIASEWSGSEPMRAWEWAQDLPGDLRRAATQRVFDLWVGKDFAAAKAALETSSSEAKDLLLQSVARNAPKGQIGAVAEMVAREPISMSRAAASQDLMFRWAIWDPAPASEWLGQQPPGMVQDQAILGLTRGLLNSGDTNEPQAVLEWTATISNPELRARELEGWMGRYRTAVPSVARAWVDSTTRLTEAERARFLEVIGK